MSEPTTSNEAICVEQVTHRYGDRIALDGLSLAVSGGEIFSVLGPNGGGKTTLFRLLSTLAPLQAGSIRVFGRDLEQDPVAVRRSIGVVFQSPGLDRKLTVLENMALQAVLYGIPKRQAGERIDRLLREFGLEDRRRDLVETLSGGLRRRVELAKGLLHSPRLLLLDEPSTGLDPGARSDLWRCLTRLRDEEGVTIALTTHLLEEAERADRIAILDRGRVVALDAPDALRRQVGGDAISIQTLTPQELADQIHIRLNLAATVVGREVRLEQPNGHEWVPQLVREFPEAIDSIKLGKPTLEDVFISKTGHGFWNDESDGLAPDSTN